MCSNKKVGCCVKKKRQQQPANTIYSFWSITTCCCLVYPHLIWFPGKSDLSFPGTGKIEGSGWSGGGQEFLVPVPHSRLWEESGNGHVPGEGLMRYPLQDNGSGKLKSFSILGSRTIVIATFSGILLFLAFLHYCLKHISEYWEDGVHPLGVSEEPVRWAPHPLNWFYSFSL